MAHSFEVDGRALEATAGFAWLFEVEVPTEPATRLRVTSNNLEVHFGVNSLGADIVYTPWPIAVATINRQTKGDLPRISVSVSNARQALPAMLDAHDGFVGQPAVVQLISLGETANASASLRFDGDVVSSNISVEQVNFTIGSYTLKGSKFPRERYIAEHCRFRWGSAECGYNTQHALASYTSCPKTYAACEARGDDEEDVMLVGRQHPERFGGWRAIPFG